MMSEAEEEAALDVGNGVQTHSASSDPQVNQELSVPSNTSKEPWTVGQHESVDEVVKDVESVSINEDSHAEQGIRYSSTM